MSRHLALACLLAVAGCAFFSNSLSGQETSGLGGGLPAVYQGIEVTEVCSRLGIACRAIRGPDGGSWIAIDSDGDVDRVRAEIKRMLSSPPQNAQTPEPPTAGMPAGGPNSGDAGQEFARRREDLVRKGDYAGAARLFLEEIPRVQREYGPHHWMVASYLACAAQDFEKGGIWAEAERLRKEAVAAAERSGDAENISIHRRNLADFYRDREIARRKHEEEQRKREAEERAHIEKEEEARRRETEKRRQEDLRIQQEQERRGMEEEARRQEEARIQEQARIREEQERTRMREEGRRREELRIQQQEEDARRRAAEEQARLQAEEEKRKREESIRKLLSELKPVASDRLATDYGLRAEFKPLGEEYDAPQTAWEQALFAAHASEMARQAANAEEARFYAAESFMTGGKIHVKWSPPKLSLAQERKIEEMGRKIAQNQEQFRALEPRIVDAREEVQTLEIRKNEMTRKRDGAKQNVEAARQTTREAPPERKPEIDNLLALAEQELLDANTQLAAAEQDWNAAKQEERNLSRQQKEIEEQIRQLQEQILAEEKNYRE